MRDWPVGRLTAAIRAREVSCEEVTVAFIERARDADAQLGYFIELTAESALARARQSDARLARGDAPGPLCGVPFAAKDVFVQDGGAPTAGTRGVPIPMAARSATVLDRLDAAGAVSLGRLNLDPFSYTVTGANPDFGDIGNPWDPRRLAGGSSGAVAAAVAVGAVPFGIGTDTGGSGRIPASHCGITALKPTFGRIPKRGSVPVSYSQDAVSVLARSAADVARVLETVAGHDPLDPGSIDARVEPWTAQLDGHARLDGLRVGVDLPTLHTAVDSGAAIVVALRVITELGASLVEVDLEALARYDAAATVLTWSEVAAAHTPMYAACRGRYPPATRTRLDAAQLAHGADHVNALRYRGRALGEFLGGVLAIADVIALPTTAVGPPLRDALGHDDVMDVQSTLDALALTRPFSFLGVPALSLPVGVDRRGFPLGLQLVARPWDERRLFACAAAYQAVTEWHLSAPPLDAAPTGFYPD